MKKSLHSLNLSRQNLFSRGSGIKEGVWVVTRCTLIASLASVIAGMSGGITSPALLELSNENQTIVSQYFDEESLLPSLFGVLIHNRIQSTYVDYRLFLMLT